VHPGAEQRGRRRRTLHTTALPPPGSLTISQTIPPPSASTEETAECHAECEDHRQHVAVRPLGAIAQHCAGHRLLSLELLHRGH